MVLSRVSLLRLRTFVTSSKYCTQTVTDAQKDSYYKNLLANQDDDSKPSGWDDAKPYNTIPGPKPLPVIGNMWRFLPGGDFHNIKFDKILLRLQKQYGKVVRFGGIIGRKEVVYLFDPDDMENILRNAGTFPIRDGIDSIKYYRTVLRKDVFKGIGGLLVVHGEEWYNLRTVVNPILMHPRTIQQYTSKVDDISKDFVKYIKQRSQNNETGENFATDLYKFALESVAIVALNRRVGALDIVQDPEVSNFITAVLQMIDQLYYLEVLPPYWKFLPSKKFNDFVKNMDLIADFITKNIDEGLKVDVAENVPEHEQSVLRRMAKKDKKIAFVMAIEMLGGGVDTTGKTMGATLYFLAKNPDKQNILREEIMKFLPYKSSKLTNEALNKMTYLKAVIKEATRIAPIGVVNIRTTTKDMVIGGYQIPKNTDVYPMHYYPTVATDDNFKEAEKFIPERWLRTTVDEYSAKNAHPFAMMPFGFGPRACVGKRLANLELEVGLANIIRNFELSWNRPDMQFGAMLLYGFLDPLQLKIKELD